MWGGTGQALVVHEFLGGQGFDLIAVLDRNAALVAPFPAIPTFGGADAFERWAAGRPDGDLWFIVAVGGDLGRERLAIGQSLIAAGLCPATLLHPTAFIAGDASVGPGSVVLAQSAVAARARIGAACIINTRASIDHECVLGDGVHVGPGATLAGCVRVGNGSFVASGVTVAPFVRIGEDSVIGAGAVVVRDIPANVVAYGNPARIRRSIARAGR
jgi:sugar O-acyltransferase (sialic acid O-acetyltransferase NeuD family)